MRAINVRCQLVNSQIHISTRITSYFVEAIPVERTYPYLSLPALSFLNDHLHAHPLAGGTSGNSIPLAVYFLLFLMPLLSVYIKFLIKKMSDIYAAYFWMLERRRKDWSTALNIHNGDRGFIFQLDCSFFILLLMTVSTSTTTDIRLFS